MTAPATAGLPFVDEHAVDVAAPRDLTWAALEQHVRTALRLGPRHPLALLLGTHPRAGFEVADRDEGRSLTLTGRHRFSRYALRFVLDDRPEERQGTRLSALSHAEFPGLHGRLYRLAVIGSRGHVLATRHVLHAIRRRAEAQPDLTPP